MMNAKCARQNNALTEKPNLLLTGQTLFLGVMLTVNLKKIEQEFLLLEANHRHCQKTHIHSSGLLRGILPREEVTRLRRKQEPPNQ